MHSAQSLDIRLPRLDINQGWQDHIPSRLGRPGPTMSGDAVGEGQPTAAGLRSWLRWCDFGLGATALSECCPA